jgi:hypothetical protein
MIIGLTGYAQSGKDSVANVLVEQYGYTRVAFADKIRELLIETNPLIRDGFRVESVVSAYGWDQAKILFPEIRYLLQSLGVGARKLFGPQFWVHEAMKTMLNEPRTDLNYVITDVRFTNEADMIKANHGQLWRIKRPGVGAVNAHVSESDMDGYKVDKILSNGGTLEELELLVHTRMDSKAHAN